MNSQSQTVVVAGVRVDLELPRAPSHPSKRTFVALAALLVLAILFRIPPLLNAAGVHSDAAVIGLQAMHLLKGEWSWFVWGTRYQGVIDVLLTAGVFAVFGASPLALMTVPLAGHLVLIGLVFSVLCRWISLSRAFLLCLVLVFTPQAINGVALYLPRQWSVTLVFLCVWMMDRAVNSRRSNWWFASAGLVAAVALYADLFVAVFIPGIALLAILSSMESGRPSRAALQRIASFAFAAGIALGSYALIRQGQGISSHKAQLTLSNVADNWRLLVDQCMPWALSYGVYIPGEQLTPQRWQPPGFEAFQRAAALLLGMLLLLAAGAVLLRALPWSLRRLGAFGIVAACCSIGTFMFSIMPTDMWGARYLAPIIWGAPFALAPATVLFRRGQLTMLLAPYIISAGVGGWVSYGPYVDGIMPVVSESGSGKDERELATFLRNAGIKHAGAQYWLAYRLTFLFKEDPIVYPPLLVEDRYPPYRAQAMQAAIVHPSEPRMTEADVLAMLRQNGMDFQKYTVGKYTVFIPRSR